MGIVRTNKFLNNEQVSVLRGDFELASTSPAIVLLDRGGKYSERFGNKSGAPMSDPDVFRARFHERLNALAVESGLAPAEEFIDEDGDEAINNYGLDFQNGEILFWDESTG